MPELTIPTTVATSAMSFVNTALATNGVIYLLVIAGGIPLLFYGVKKVIALIPKK